MSRIHNRSVTASIASGSHHYPFPLPAELTVDILELIDKEDLWSFAKTSRACYAFARRNVLYREVRVGWSYILNFVRTAKGLFNPKGALVGRFESDVEFARKIGIGELVRELYVGLDTNKNEDDPEREFGLCEAIKTLAETMPNLAMVKVFGTNKSNLFETTVNSLGRCCSELSSLTMHWSWDRCPERGVSSLEFPMFPGSLKSLKLGLSTDEYDDVSWQSFYRGNFVGATVTSLVRPALAGGKLQSLEVSVFSDVDDVEEGVDWSSFGQNPSIEKFMYEYVLGSRSAIHTAAHADNSGSADRIWQISTVCGRFPNVQDLTLRQQCFKVIPPEVIDQLPTWLGGLKQCRRLQILANLPSDPDIENSDEDEFEIVEFKEVWENRKEIMGKIAENMPKLVCFMWPLYIEGDITPCNMSIERGCNGEPVEVKFNTSWEPSY